MLAEKEVDPGFGDNFVPGAPVAFDIVVPTTNAALNENVRHALTLGLPEADNRLAPLTIVANGPSARGLKFEGPTMALNGAINLPVFRRTGPDMWVACDPQKLVAGFIKRPKKNTTYLVASKCHASVFKKLKAADVRLWHLSDVEFVSGRVVPCATSVTLTSLLLAQRLGARRIDVWGWDCCFADDGAHHAAGSELNPNNHTIDVRVGPAFAHRRRVRRLARLHREKLPARSKPVNGLRHDRIADRRSRERSKEFKSTPTWCLEAQEAVNILPLLRWAGVDVVIHGDGMVRAIAAEFAAKPLPGLKL